MSYLYLIWSLYMHAMCYSVLQSTMSRIFLDSYPPTVISSNFKTVIASYLKFEWIMFSSLLRRRREIERNSSSLAGDSITTLQVSKRNTQGKFRKRKCQNGQIFINFGTFLVDLEFRCIDTEHQVLKETVLINVQYL